MLAGPWPGTKRTSSLPRWCRAVEARVNWKHLWRMLCPNNSVIVAKLVFQRESHLGVVNAGGTSGAAVPVD